MHAAQGNHFNEYAGFECEYGRYPDAKKAAHFLRHYLTEAKGSPPVSATDTVNTPCAALCLSVSWHCYYASWQC